MERISIPDQYLLKIEPKKYSPWDFERIGKRPTLGELLQREEMWVVSNNHRELGLEYAPTFSFSLPQTSEVIKNANVLYLDRIGQNYQPTILYFDDRGRVVSGIYFLDADLYAMSSLGVGVFQPKDLTPEIIEQIRISEEDLTKLYGLPVDKIYHFDYLPNGQLEKEAITYGKYQENGETLTGVVVYERALMTPVMVIPAMPHYGISSRGGLFCVREKRRLHPYKSFYRDPIDHWKKGYYFVVEGFGHKIYEFKSRNPYRETPPYERYGHMLVSRISTTLHVIDENKRELERVGGKEFY